MKLNSILFGAIFITVTLSTTVLGQLCIKKGMLQVSENVQGIFNTLVNGLTNVWVVSGLALAVVAAFAWMITLSRLPLSYAYPFLSITFPIVVILSSMVFGEAVSVKTFWGLGIIVIGLIIVSTGS